MTVKPLNVHLFSAFHWEGRHLAVKQPLQCQRARQGGDKNIHKRKLPTHSLFFADCVTIVLFLLMAVRLANDGFGGVPRLSGERSLSCMLPPWSTLPEVTGNSSEGHGRSPVKIKGGGCNSSVRMSHLGLC